jgi:hypothetical protein
MTKIATTGEHVVAQEGMTPTQCPFCRVAFDVSADQINAFRSFYRNRVKGQTNVGFRVPVGEATKKLRDTE